jgi:HAD superfamily hydrolase (TIGR01509 family)
MIVLEKPPIRSANDVYQAIIFDLYGTLLHFDQRAMLRDLVRVIGNTRDSQGKTSLRDLMVRHYDSDTEMLNDFVRALGVEFPTSTQLAACQNVLNAHISQIKPYPGVRTLLTFLRGRGLKIGLLSNAAQVFKSPLETLGLSDYFDAISFSCDTGLAKPNPKAYQNLCDELSVAPSQCLFVGDSIENDERVPTSLGMNALCLRQHTAPRQIADLAWCALTPDQPWENLLALNQCFTVDGLPHRITKIETLPDEQQGRYNIVAKVVGATTDGQVRTFFAKRYLSPESVNVEYTAFRFLELLGLSGCSAEQLHGNEPMLLTTPALGQLWTAADLDEDTCEGIGAHCAAAYLMGNADLRPRNTFVHRANGGAQITVIDLEHCFFDRALDLSDCGDPFSPATIDALGESVELRTRHRVLSPAATRRARRSFLALEDRSHPRVQAFRQGWIMTFERAKQRIGEIEALLMERVHAKPPLVIGTRSYRRAMAELDVRDLLERILEDAALSFDRHY